MLLQDMFFIMALYFVNIIISVFIEFFLSTGNSSTIHVCLCVTLEQKFLKILSVLCLKTWLLQ